MSRVITFSKDDPEVWIPVKGYEGKYEVSSFGNIKSLARTCKKWDGIRRVNEKILSPGKSSNGYMTVGLCQVKRKAFHIHKLVFTHFYNIIIPKGMQINHKDGNKENNAAYNLELETPSGNMKHAFRIGLHGRPKGEINNMAKLSNLDIINIREMIKNGITDKDISEKFKISKKYASEIRHNKTRFDENYTPISGRNTKKVIDINTKMIFQSTKEAAIFYGINRGTLVCMLCGKNKNKTNLQYL